jgi:hypothetical protein
MAKDPNADAHPCTGPNHITKNGNYLYLTCSLSHEIHIINTRSLKMDHIINLMGAHNPMTSLIADNDLAYTSAYTSNKLFAFSPHLDIKLGENRMKGNIDLNSLTLEYDGSEQTSPRPGSMARIENIGFVALANLTKDGVAGGPGYVLAFDIPSNTMTKLIKTRGHNTTGVFAGVTSDTKNLLYIVNTGTYVLGKGYGGDGSVDVYDLEKDTIIQTIRFPGAPGTLDFATDGRAYLSNSNDSSVFSFHTSTFETYPPISLSGNRCEGGNTNQAGFISSVLVDKDLLYATEFTSNCLLVIDRNSNKFVRKFQTGSGPVAMLAL